MFLLSWITVMLSSGILILLCGIMKGFEKETYRSLQGIYAQASLHAPENKTLDLETLASFITIHIPEITAWSPKTVRYGVLEKEGSSLAPLMVTIILLDPKKDSLVSCLSKKLNNEKNLEKILSPTAIIIGHTASTYLNLHEQETILLSIAESLSSANKTPSYETVEVTIGGIATTGIEEIDMHTIFCSYELYETIFNHTPIEQIDIQFASDVDEITSIKKIHTLTGLTVSSWKELYPALLDSLKLEKKVSFLITFLIVCMALTNIIALLYMYIQSKRADIALLLILGASVLKVRTIFLFMGIIISISAIFCGIFLALGISIYVNSFHPISLPEAYYASHITIILDPSTVGFFSLLIFFAAIVACIIPTLSITTSSLAHIIRFER